ncbi:MAG: S16 family serine protease [Nanoarchaeota archaeon]|nr:S16 family serine protease [Nanoarchaeota archaeon]
MKRNTIYKNRSNTLIIGLLASFIIILIVSNLFAFYIIKENIGKITSDISYITGSISGLVSADNSNGGVNTLESFKREISIPIVAVSVEGKGILGKLNIKLVQGENNILINTNPFLELEIQKSIAKGVRVAKLKTENYNLDKDLVFDFQISNSSVMGGESAGAAITVASIALLNGIEIKNDTAITGSINSDGSIGNIGGVKEKAKSVASAGYKYFIIPQGQSSIPTPDEGVINLKEYAKQEWNLEIIEVSTIEEALPYFVK